MNQDAIISMLGDRPLAYHPILAKSLGSVKAAIFLSQLLYWQGKGRYGDWTYKTADEFYEETGLSRKEQETAREILRKHGIIEEKRAGVPARLHFKVNLEKLTEIVSSFTQSTNLVCTEGENKIDSSGQSIHSETTQETTQEITSSAQSAKKKPPASKKSNGLLPDTKLSRMAFGLLQASAKERGNGNGPRSFHTIEQKQKFDRAIVALGEQEAEKALNTALGNGVNALDRLVNYVAAWKPNGGGKPSPPSDIDKIAASIAISRRHDEERMQRGAH